MSQKEDKARIYNSREWVALRNAKRAANPFCERCIEMGKAAGVKRGWLTPTRVIHHIIPIETAHSYEEMKRLAFCGLDGLQALCFKCHSEVHKQLDSRTKDGHKRATQAAIQRWIDRNKKKDNDKRI